MNGKTIKDLKVGDTAFFEKTITDADVILFAGVSGDLNPVHIDELYAKTSIFKKRIVHGGLVNALFSTVLGTQLPGNGTIYMGQNSKFLKPVFLDAMERLTNSAENYDARADLDKITAPTLIVAADEDYLTPIANQKYLHAHIKDSEYILIPGAGHAAMYEKPLLFTTLILGFVNALDTKYNI